MAAVALRPWSGSPLSAGTRKPPATAAAQAMLRPSAAFATAPASSPPSRPRKKVLVPIGLGTEEMEAVILVDVLRRAGADVVLASVETGLEVEASSGTRLVADAGIAACADEIYDLVALPGGMPGSVRLRDCKILQKMTTMQAEEKRLYGAICAAPAVVLMPWGLHRRKQLTCHPAFIDKLPPFRAVRSNVQVSGELTTSRGPGTTFQFALSFVEQLFDSNVAEDISGKLLMQTHGVHERRQEFNKIEWSFNHTPRVLVPIANGCEEMEVVTLVDILRRAKVDVVIASVEKSKQIVASQKTKIVADKSIADASDSIYDLIIVPGGVAGSERMNRSRILKKMLREQKKAGRVYGGTCSSAAIVMKQGLLTDKIATAHPATVGELDDQVADGAEVVIDGKLITGRGLGNITGFALAIVSKLFGHARARSVAEGIVFEYAKS